MTPHGRAGAPRLRWTRLLTILAVLALGFLGTRGPRRPRRPGDASGRWTTSASSTSGTVWTESWCCATRPAPARCSASSMRIRPGRSNREACRSISWCRAWGSFEGVLGRPVPHESSVPGGRHSPRWSIACPAARSRTQPRPPGGCGCSRAAGVSQSRPVDSALGTLPPRGGLSRGRRCSCSATTVRWSPGRPLTSGSWCVVPPDRPKPRRRSSSPVSNSVTASLSSS